VNYKLLFFSIFLLSNILFAKNSTQKVNLQLSWLHQFQFAGYYVAKEKGFYKDSGIDVNIKEYKYGLDIRKTLLNKESEFVIGKTSFIIDRISGQKIIALLAVYQHSPMMLLVREDSSIKTVKDLRGKNIMITKDAKNTASILAMLSSQKVDLNELNIQKHSFDVQDLISGKTDVMASYVSNEPIKLKEKGIKYKILHPKDYGFDFYNGMLFTSQNFLDKSPDTVKAFHDATIRGWKWAFEHIEESAEIIFDKYNTQNKTLEDFIKEGKILKTLAFDNKHKLGHISRERLREIANVFLVMGLVNKDYNFDDFIYEYNGKNSKKIYLTQEETKWIKNHPNLSYGGSNWAPIHNYTKNNQSEGIAEDILQLISEEINLRVQYKKQNTWNEALKHIKDKTLDFGLATSSSDRKKEYGLFTKSYINFPLVIVTKNNVSYISSTSELNNKVVAVGENYTGHNFLKENYPQVKILALKDSNEALEAVKSNRAYAMVEILPVAAHKIRELNYSNLKISGTTEFNFEVKAFVRDDYPLLVSILNKGIDSLNNKKINEIITKWIAVKYVQEIDYKLVMEVVLFFIIVIALVIYVQNRKLKKSNKKLKVTLANLKETREDLLASEKMATLGELVGGVTHEIISPLSVGIMGSSYISDMTDDINELYNAQDMSEGDFRDYIADVSETSKSISLNLNRTKILVNSFKDVAVDQAFEDVRDFVVKSYVDEILLSMTSKLKQTKIKVHVECDGRLVVKSHPGYIAQILFNFINNSLTHGFKENEEGEIRIIFTEKSLDKKLELIYKDNGKGVPEKINHKVFDEFYTTKKGQGGTGLGLYIVKTIVENKLGGIISFKSDVGKGVEIKILIPLGEKA